MSNKRLIEQRPDYYHGQLLLEDDFLAEQRFHINARQRHNLNCHGWGVVRGLEVVVSGGNSVTVRPGFAIDEQGRDIVVDEAETIDIAGFEAEERVKIGLAYEEAQGEATGTAAGKRIGCFALLTVSAMAKEIPAGPSETSAR